MIAIITKYLGPTNHLGSRVSATIPGWGGKPAVRAVVDYDDSFGPTDAHYLAALAVAKKRGEMLEREFGAKYGHTVVLKYSKAELEKGYVFLCGHPNALEGNLELDLEAIAGDPDR